ncbi:MAG: GNAT family N-acetyltransferase [Clostridiales bacterium]|nr:GNAT family N-acetyltransferase [Clostridiales bacterium]
MHIKQCTVDDVKELATLNQQLIEDEKSDNKMNLAELEERMREFLRTDYHAYFFLDDHQVLGYALVKYTSKPYYIRQFLIDRKYRKQHIGTQAFDVLQKELDTDVLDLEVLSWNEAGKKFWEKCGFVERSRYLRRTDAECRV